MAMTDKELKDAALLKFDSELTHLKKTTRGLKGFTPPAGSEWGMALKDREDGIALIKQIGITPTPPPTVTQVKQNIINGQTLSGKVTWTATVTGEIPSKVEFLIDGAVKHTEINAPYQFNGDPDGLLDTTTLSKGSHTLEAKASVASGVSSVTAAVNVDNSVVVPPDPPPVTGNAYFVDDFSSGKIGSPHVTLFYPGNPGYVDLTETGPQAQTPDGRVKVVDNPYGSGKVVRCEIQNSDPNWGGSVTGPIHKAEVRTDENHTCNGQFVMGQELWIYHEFALPNEFSLCTGGGNNFTDIGPELHNNSSSKWPTISVTSYPGPNICLQIDGGDGSMSERPPLFPLDAAHRNRMLKIVIGVKLTDQNTGWVEAYIDGQQVLKRTNRPTVWPGENGPYYKWGLYKDVASKFANGGAVIFHGKTLIGKTKADIGM